MKITNEEVERIFGEVWPKSAKSYLIEEFNVNVIENTERRILVSVTSMYEPPGLTFAQLMQLSEAFGTKQIDASSKIEESGCETCDYGSSYGFNVDIRPEAKSDLFG